MFNFEYYSPTQVVFGKETEDRVGELVQQYGASRVMIHYGGQSAVRSGLLDKVKKSLDEKGIFHVEVGGVVPNPHLSKVREGMKVCQENDVDFILAVGGGSVIDSAKAIAAGLADPDKDVWELYAHTRRHTGHIMPIGVILTIAAAGSETSNGSVLTNEETGSKRDYVTNEYRPKFAVMDPELTMTLPDYQTEAGCADIMMHTMERYFTKGGNMELTDEIAEGLMRVVMKYAEILHKDPANYEARAEVMWAGSLAHNDLTGCGNDGGDFATHMIQHELGGMFNVTHGAGLAAIWPSWARYVHQEDLPRFVRFAEKVMQVARTPEMTDEDVALAGISAMEDFYHRIGMPVNMTELGIAPTDEQMKAMAESAYKAVGHALGSAKKLGVEDIVSIYKMAK